MFKKEGFFNDFERSKFDQYWCESWILKEVAGQHTNTQQTPPSPDANGNSSKDRPTNTVPKGGVLFAVWEKVYSGYHDQSLVNFSPHQDNCRKVWDRSKPLACIFKWWG